MFEEYLNKSCVVVAAHATATLDGGSAAANYIGTLVGETEDYIIVNVVKVMCDAALAMRQTVSGKTYINKRYIVAISFK